MPDYLIIEIVFCKECKIVIPNVPKLSKINVLENNILNLRQMSL